MAPDYDQPRQFRVPDNEWLPFEQAAKAQHPTGRGPRAAVLREFIRWYMRRPGAELPERPPAGPWSTGAAEASALPAKPVANPRRSRAAEPGTEA
jgi:hypothetical protein